MDLMDQMVSDLACALEDTNKKTTMAMTTLPTMVTAAVSVAPVASTSSAANANINLPTPRSKNGNSRAAAWAHRRSRSTSHLNLPSSTTIPADPVHKSESEDTSKGGNDSDDAERSLAKLTLHQTTAHHQRPLGASKSLKHSRTCSMPLTKQCIVESDSVNELFSPTQTPSSSLHHVPTPHSKRPRRRHKRMAVEISPQNSTTDGDLMMPCSSRTAAALMGPPFLKTAPLVICKMPGSSSSRSGASGGSKKKSLTAAAMKDIRMELTGKRKRSHRQEKTGASCAMVAMTSNSAPEPSVLNPDDHQGLSTMDLVHMGMDALCGSGDENDNEDEAMMQSEASSLSSSSDSEGHRSCDEGQEGDDEHSDWVGDEWIDDMDDPESRRNLIIKRLLHCGDSREIRAGKRKGYPNKPIFSVRTSANEQLSKFLQNKEQSELKLHPMRKEEQIKLGQLASLYSLQMHCLENDSTTGLTCPVLTKTSNTTQMDNTTDDKSAGIVPGPVLSESDTKRMKM